MYKIFNKIYKFVAYGSFDIKILLNNILMIVSIWIITLCVSVPVMSFLQVQFKYNITNKYYVLVGILFLELISYIVIRNYFNWLENMEEKICEKYVYLNKTGAWYDVRRFIVSGYSDNDYDRLNKQAREEVIAYQQKRIDNGEIKTLKQLRETIDRLEVNESDFNIEHLR